MCGWAVDFENQQGQQFDNCIHPRYVCVTLGIWYSSDKTYLYIIYIYNSMFKKQW